MTLTIRWLALFAGCLAATLAPAQTIQRPNIVVVIADDLAWDDCGCYGNPHVGTPNIDRLAAGGMRFTQAFLTCSSCSPSRASVMTGRYPHNTGAEQLHWPLPSDQVTFPELLKASGYWVASAGKWHLGPALKPKFDRVVEGKGHWVEALRDRPHDRPFFLWLGSTDPHRPYAEGTFDPPHKPTGAVVPPYLPDVPETRADLAQYYDAISRLDRDLGQVLDELDKGQLVDETIVIFMSDNGRPFPRCKTTIYDSGIKTPFIVRWPKRVTAGSVCSSLVSSIDIAPTLLDVAGVALPDSFQGESFQPLLGDPKATIRPLVFAEHNWHDYAAYDRAVRGPRYTLIRNGYLDLPATPPADAVKGATFQAMRQLKDAGKLTPEQGRIFVTPRPAVELYDLENDPHELVNLAGHSDLAMVERELSAALDTWQRETRDRMPLERMPEIYSRETGDPLTRPLKRVPPRPELRAEQTN